MNGISLHLASFDAMINPNVKLDAGVNLGMNFGEVLGQAAAQNGMIPTAQALRGVEPDEKPEETNWGVNIGTQITAERKLSPEEAEELIDGLIELLLSNHENGGLKPIIPIVADEETHALLCRIFAEKVEKSGNEYLKSLNPSDLFKIADDEEEDEAEDTGDLIKKLMKDLKEHYEKLEEEEIEIEESTDALAASAVWLIEDYPYLSPKLYELPPDHPLYERRDSDIVRTASAFGNGIPEEELLENRTVVPPPKEDLEIKFVNANANANASPQGVATEITVTAEFSAPMLKINDAKGQLEDIAREFMGEQTDAENQNPLGATVQEITAQEITAPHSNFAAESVSSSETTLKTLDFGTAVNVGEQVMEKLIPAAISLKDGGSSEMTIVLKPESLGEVALKLVQESGKVSITLAAQHEAVGAAINDRLWALSDGLFKQNIEVNDINVIDPSDAASQMGLDFTNQGFNRKEDYFENSGNKSYGDGIRIDDVIIDEKAIHESILNKEAKLWTRA